MLPTVWRDMTMKSAHFASSFKQSCVIAPRQRGTKLPTTELERSMNGDDFNEDEHFNPDSDYQEVLYDESEAVNSRPPAAKVMPKAKSDQSMSFRNQSFSQEELSELLRDDDKFFDHLQELKRENKKTLKALERLYKYQAEERELKQTGSRPKGSITCGRFAKTNTKDSMNSVRNTQDRVREESWKENPYTETSFQTDASHQYDVMDSIKDMHLSKWRTVEGSIRSKEHDLIDSDSEELHDESENMKRPDHLNILPDEPDGDFRGRSSSVDVINNMWENFSVESFAMDEKSPKPVRKSKQEWTHTLTIPEPFEMTKREAALAKVRAQRREKIEKELMMKKAQEEAELNKKFKARPLPPSTFLPLYKELQLKDQQRRDYTNTLSKAILERTQKPFGFMKREELKKEYRRSQSMENLNQFKEKKTEFKAKPFPEKLFDLSLQDKLAEQDEYRKIKVKLRSQEMLASASLPPNMQARGQRYRITSNSKKRATHGTTPKKAPFTPNINHEIPNFELLKEKFDKEFHMKKKQKGPTICEPFNLHTAKIPSRQSARIQNHIDTNGGIADRRTPQRKRPTSAQSAKRADVNKSYDPPPYSVTESARLRQSSVRRSLDSRRKKEEEEQLKELQQRQREKELRNKVARKAAANDLNRKLKEQSAEKLKSFRESDRARQKEYQQYLRDLQARVEERPLLFEQESQVNARRKAERKYEEILREAGVDENIVKNLVTKEGNIIDADSDDSGGFDEDYDVNKRQDETFTSDNFEGSLTGDDVRPAVIEDKNDKENYDNDLPKSDEDVSAVSVDDYDDDEL